MVAEEGEASYDSVIAMQKGSSEEAQVCMVPVSLPSERLMRVFALADTRYVPVPLHLPGMAFDSSLVGH